MFEANIFIVNENNIANIASIRTKFDNTLEALKRLRINDKFNLNSKNFFFFDKLD